MVRLRVLLCTFVPALFAAPLSVGGQEVTGTVRGTVSRASDSQPFANVTVTVRGTALSAVTASDGRYVLERVPAGAQTLQFRSIGYAALTIPVTMPAGGAITADAAFSAQTIQLSEVIVTSASRVPERIVDAPAAVSSVDPALLKNLAPSGQMPLALANTPGVDIVQGGMNQFDVNARGMTNTFNRRLLVLQDGRDVAAPLPGSPFEWSSMSIPLDESSRMELVRGPGSALYGPNAFNGVLDIRTPAPRDIQGSRISITGAEQAGLQLDARNAGVVAGGRLGYRANVGYRRSNDWATSRTALDSLDLRREYAGATPYTVLKGRDARPLNGQTLGAGNVALGTADPTEATYGSARLDWYAQSGVVATAEAGLSNVQNDLYTSQSGRFQRTSIDRPWARVNVGAESFNLMAWYTGDRSKEPYYNIAANRAFEHDASAMNVEGQFNRWIAGDRARLIAGASFRSTEVRTNATYLAPADDNRRDNIWALFGQVETGQWHGLKLVTALRWDDGDLMSSQFSPKAALMYTPVDGQVFRLTFNQAFRIPTPIERFTQSTNAVPQTTPRVRENGLNAYMGNVRNAITGGAVPASVGAGLNIATLPWGFDSLTYSTNRGNRNLLPETVSGWEVGYKGSVGRRVFVTLDAYRNDIRNFVTNALPGVNPSYPTYRLDDGRNIGIVATLDSLAARLAAAGVASTDPLRSSIPALRSSFLTFANSVQATRLVTLPNGTRAMVQSFTNAGRVIAQGIDLGASAQVIEKVRVDASLSYFDFEVLDQRVGGRQPANTPRWKGTLGASYAGARTDVNVSARRVKEFLWSTGVWVGKVPSSTSVHVAGGYRVHPRLRLHGVVTNLFDQERFHTYGGAVIGRRAMVGITTDF